MKHRNRFSQPRPVSSPTNAMKAMLLDAREAMQKYYEAEIDRGNRNEWIAFIIAQNDACTRLCMPIEKAPPELRGSLIKTKHGDALVASIPSLVFDNPAVLEHPYFSPIRKLNRSAIGNDLLVCVYAFGQVFAGALKRDFGIMLLRLGMDQRQADMMEEFHQKMIPNLRQMLVIDSRELGIPPNQVAYYIGVARSRDGRISLTRTDFETSSGEILTFADTYSLDRLRKVFSEEFPVTREALELPVESGYFRVFAQFLGMLNVCDFPIVEIPPHRGARAH